MYYTTGIPSTSVCEKEREKLRSVSSPQLCSASLVSLSVWTDWSTVSTRTREQREPFISFILSQTTVVSSTLLFSFFPLSHYCCSRDFVRGQSLTVALFRGWPIYRQGRYIGRYLPFFKYRHRPISFLFVRCVRGGTFILMALNTQRSHSPSCSFTVLSNMDRSLSNNQIEWLNKGINVYKKYYNDCFYIISNRKANIIILSRLLSAFNKYAFISFKQIFEWLMNL